MAPTNTPPRPAWRQRVLLAEIPTSKPLRCVEKKRHAEPPTGDVRVRPPRHLHLCHLCALAEMLPARRNALRVLQMLPRVLQVPACRPDQPADQTQGQLTELS